MHNTTHRILSPSWLTRRVNKISGVRLELSKVDSRRAGFRHSTRGDSEPKELMRFSLLMDISMRKSSTDNSLTRWSRLI